MCEIEEQNDTLSNDPDVITSDWDDKPSGRSSAAYKHGKKLEIIQPSDQIIVEYEKDEY
jgi:hypothetical protein